MKVIDLANIVRDIVHHDYVLVFAFIFIILVFFGVSPAARYAAVVYGTMSVGWIMKIVFDETRPDGSGMASFPSGSTMVITVFLLYFFYQFVRHVKCKIELKLFVGAIGMFLVFLMAYQRLYHNLHTPEEIFAGFIVSFAFFFFFTWLYELIVDKIMNKWKFWIWLTKFKGITPIIAAKIKSRHSN